MQQMNTTNQKNPRLRWQLACVMFLWTLCPALAQESRGQDRDRYVEQLTEESERLREKNIEQLTRSVSTFKHALDSIKAQLLELEQRIKTLSEMEVGRNEPSYQHKETLRKREQARARVAATGKIVTLGEKRIITMEEFKANRHKAEVAEKATRNHFGTFLGLKCGDVIDDATRLLGDVESIAVPSNSKIKRKRYYHNGFLAVEIEYSDEDPSQRFIRSILVQDFEGLQFIQQRGIIDERTMLIGLQYSYVAKKWGTTVERDRKAETCGYAICSNSGNEVLLRTMERRDYVIDLIRVEWAPTYCCSY